MRSSGLDEEMDEYDELLAALGRTEEQDRRIAVHEAGHALCARLLGHEVGGVTVNPDPSRGSRVCAGVLAIRRHSQKVAAMHQTFARCLRR